MNIENFKIKDFVKQKPELIEQYLTVLNYVKPKPTRKEIFHMKLKHVEFIKENLYSEDDEALIKIIKKVQKVDEKQIMNMTIIEFFGILNSIKKQMSMIQRAEENSLTPSEVNLKWEMVKGSERMAKFGLYNTLESLSGGDILKYKQIMNLNYSEVFTVLMMRKTASDLAAEMDKIKIK